MHSTTVLASLAVGLAALRGVQAAFDGSSNANIAVYWGQNSAGAATDEPLQQRLSYYCANNDIDVIPLGFVVQISDPTDGYPELNFANQGDRCTPYEGKRLFHCPELEADIQSCQQDHNTTILLSIGGAAFTDGGFANTSEAIAAADMIWATFGPPPAQNITTTTTPATYNPYSDSTNCTTATAAAASTLRPFGLAQVDGFDFDLESPTTNMAPFAHRLRALMDAATRADSRPRFLTAAPQCTFPDAYADQLLRGGGAALPDDNNNNNNNNKNTTAVLPPVPLDAVFVQYYNNWCDLAHPADTFNFAQWDVWARQTSANRDVRVLLGVPGGPTAAEPGAYRSLEQLRPVVEGGGGVKGYGSFGGVMVWDASQAEGNAGFLAGVRGLLGDGGEDGGDGVAVSEVEAAYGGYGEKQRQQEQEETLVPSSNHSGGAEQRRGFRIARDLGA